VPGDRVSISASLEGYRSTAFPEVALRPHETVSGVVLRLAPKTTREIVGRVLPAPGAELREPRDLASYAGVDPAHARRTRDMILAWLEHDRQR
jgi:hypothetical protein